MNIYIPDTLLGDTPLPHCAVSSHWRDTCVPNTLVSPRRPATHSSPSWLASMGGGTGQSQLHLFLFSLKEKESLCTLLLLAWAEQGSSPLWSGWASLPNSGREVSGHLPQLCSHSTPLAMKLASESPSAYSSNSTPWTWARKTEAIS